MLDINESVLDTSILILSQNVEQNSWDLTNFVGSFEYHSVSIFKDINNSISNSYFVIMKSYKQIIENQEKRGKLIDIFGEAQEEVLGHCSKQEIQYPG